MKELARLQDRGNESGVRRGSGHADSGSSRLFRWKLRSTDIKGEICKLTYKTTIHLQDTIGILVAVGI